MNTFSKIASSISAMLGLLIGILCSFPKINVTAIIVMSISSVLCTIMAVILDTIKDNNYIN